MNPDQPVESILLDYVWGDSPEEAIQNCKRVAEQAGLQFKGVRARGQRTKEQKLGVLRLEQPP